MVSSRSWDTDWVIRPMRIMKIGIRGRVHTTATAAGQSWVMRTSTVAGVTVAASTSWGRYRVK